MMQQQRQPAPRAAPMVAAADIDALASWPGLVGQQRAVAIWLWRMALEHGVCEGPRRLVGVPYDLLARALAASPRSAKRWLLALRRAGVVDRVQFRRGQPRARVWLRPPREAARLKLRSGQADDDQLWLAFAAERETLPLARRRGEEADHVEAGGRCTAADSAGVDAAADSDVRADTDVRTDTDAGTRAGAGAGAGACEAVRAENFSVADEAAQVAELARVVERMRQRDTSASARPPPRGAKCGAPIAKTSPSQRDLTERLDVPMKCLLDGDVSGTTSGAVPAQGPLAEALAAALDRFAAAGEEWPARVRRLAAEILARSPLSAADARDRDFALRLAMRCAGPDPEFPRMELERAIVSAARHARDGTRHNPAGWFCRAVKRRFAELGLRWFFGERRTPP